MKLYANIIEQNFGIFLSTKLDIDTISKLCYVDTITNRKKYVDKKLENYLDDISSCVNTPITIVANINSFGILDINNPKRWKVKECENGMVEIEIPDEAFKNNIDIPNTYSALVIDGNRRILTYLNSKISKNYDVVCNIYFEITRPYFLFLLASSCEYTIDSSFKANRLINHNVKKSDFRSCSREYWPPSKLSFFLTTCLYSDDKFQFYKKIKMFPYDLKYKDYYNWSIIVENIKNLITTDDSRDVHILNENFDFFFPLYNTRKDLMMDASPLRGLYLKNEDKKIYQTICKGLDKYKDIEDINERFQKIKENINTDFQ